MPDPAYKSLDDPDETIEFQGAAAHLVEIGDLTIAHLVTQPGWRWSTNHRPIVGGEWCQARHVGVIVSGRLGVQMLDGTEFELTPNDAFDVPPGHDAWTVGDEPCVQIEWSGMRAWAGFPTGIRSRVLGTLLFTDLVGSTETAETLGDSHWRELLSTHFEATRTELERFGGREIKTTGDGVLALFDGAARALHSAAAIRAVALRDGLHIRAGVHVGEVELVGADVRGIAVHEAARIMASAGTDEILLSDLTRALAGASDLAYEDRGVHALKGLDGDWRLWALASAR